MKKKIVVLTGAGMSAESGIKTFRDADGLWEGHDVMEVATPEGFQKNPALVLEFYNQRRAQLHEVSPNAGHIALADLEKHHDVIIITQNVDDLHERAGSTRVIHLHGELRKIRSTGNPGYIIVHEGDINLGDLCPKGYQLRPHIVWFGESVPEISHAANEVAHADIVMVIGSSMQVYPAAGLIMEADDDAPKFYIDPNPQLNYEMRHSGNLTVIAEKATTGVPKAIAQIMQL